MDPERKNEIDARTMKALGHPLRIQLLARLNLSPASPKQLAEELGERLPNVSYHVRVLLDADCIDLVNTVPRRGAVEHFYRAKVRPFFSDEDWARLPRSSRRSLSDSILRQIWDGAAEATRSGALDARDDRHLSRTELVLDEAGWTELNAMLRATLERAQELQVESLVRERTSGNGYGGATLNTHLVLMHYTADDVGELPQGEPAAAGEAQRGDGTAS